MMIWLVPIVLVLVAYIWGIIIPQLQERKPEWLLVVILWGCAILSHIQMVEYYALIGR